MIFEILRAANIPYREAHFTKPPAGAYAVYFAEKHRCGSDDANRWTEINATIEVYTDKPSEAVFSRLESALDARAGEMLDGWDCSDLTWIESEQLYQKVYEFEFIRRN